MAGTGRTSLETISKATGTQKPSLLLNCPCYISLRLIITSQILSFNFIYLLYQRLNPGNLQETCALITRLLSLPLDIFFYFLSLSLLSIFRTRPGNAQGLLPMLMGSEVASSSFVGHNSARGQTRASHMSTLSPLISPQPNLLLQITQFSDSNQGKVNIFFSFSAGDKYCQKKKKAA